MPKAARTCIVPRCGQLARNGPRCPEHEAGRNARRNAARADRYDAEHRRLRAAWAPAVAAGLVTCARAEERPDCPGLIAPGDAWDLDHRDDGTEHPAHVPCNRGARRNPTPALETHGTLSP